MTALIRQTSGIDNICSSLAHFKPSQKENFNPLGLGVPLTWAEHQ
jgi:hypothetical protein